MAVAERVSGVFHAARLRSSRSRCGETQKREQHLLSLELGAGAQVGSPVDR